MTTELLLRVDETGADFEIRDGDLVSDPGLESAIIVSLFSDHRADPDEVLPEEVEAPANPAYVRQVRGFWADTQGDRWGSRLYLLSRSKATPATASRAGRYAEEALGWLILNGIASAVTVEASFVELQTDDGRGEKVLSLVIGIERGTASRWDALWAAIRETDFEAAGVRIRLLAA